MKRIRLYLFIILSACMTSFGSPEPEIGWLGWNEGYELAEEQDKLLLVDVHTNWCGWCKKMDRDTYTDKEVMATISRNFVAVKLNPERTDEVYKIDTLTLNGYQLLNVLTQGERSGYPTTIVVNPRLNQIVLREAGYQDAAAMKETLAKVLGTSSRKRR